jgi:ubiquitin conjugation factor E4 B
MQNKESFIKFANGIINETNTLSATVMQKLLEIWATQEKMANTQEWGRVAEEERSISTARLVFP